MALGKKAQVRKGKLLVLKIKTKNAEGAAIPPVFEVQEKGADGKYKPREKTEVEFNGNLTRIEVRDQEWKGDEYQTVSLYFEDGDETYLLDTRVNMLTRSLYNSILGLKTFENITVGLYVFKKELNGVPAEFPAISVRQNNEMVKWSVPISDQPKPVTVMFKGKKQNDYSACDAFFIEKLREFAKVVEAAAKTVRKNENAPDAPDNNPAPDSNPVSPDAKDEDVPF